MRAQVLLASAALLLSGAAAQTVQYYDWCAALLSIAGQKTGLTYPALQARDPLRVCAGLLRAHCVRVPDSFRISAGAEKQA